MKRKQVRFGIEAPLDVPVHRSDIYERIQDEKKGAAEVEIDDGVYDYDDV